MTEATRRLIFLGIQNHKLERRAETNERLRSVLTTENKRITQRLQRLTSGDERQSRRLMIENVL